MAKSEDDEVDTGLKTEDVDWDFDGLVTVNKMERTSVRGKLCDVQGPGRGDNINAPTTVVGVVDLAAHFVSVKKQKAALERDSEEGLCDIDGFQEELIAEKRTFKQSASHKHSLHTRVAAVKEVLEKLKIGRHATRDAETALCMKILRRGGL